MSDQLKKIFIPVIIFSVILSGCTGEKTIDLNADSPIYHEILREGMANLTSANETPTEVDENISDFTLEFTLQSFKGLYSRDNNNKNPRPLFIWENVPGKDSSILRGYIKKIYGFQWIDNANILKTDELMFVWDDVPGNGSESLINFLNDDKTKAVMEIDNFITEELKIKRENDKMAIYSDNRTIHIDDKIKMFLISNNSAFLSYGDGVGGIFFPVKEKNGKNIIYDVYTLQSHNMSEERYAIYNLSIKNNGSNTFQFRLSKLRLIHGNGSQVPAYKGSTHLFDEKELKDISLLPGEITEGNVAFNVDSMYDISFLLTYDSKPIALTSFENSVLAIEMADIFDYSIAMGKPPYHINDFGKLGVSDTYDPPQPEFFTDMGYSYSQVWSNWANRSIVQFFKKYDLKELNNIKGDEDLPSTYSTYSLKVMTGKNISIYPGNPFVVTDENNEELVTSHYSEIAVSENNTFKRFNNYFKKHINLSNASLVRILFYNTYGWNMASRINQNDQIVILDENRNIVFIGFRYGHFVS